MPQVESAVEMTTWEINGELKHSMYTGHTTYSLLVALPSLYDEWLNKQYTVCTSIVICNYNIQCVIFLIKTISTSLANYNDFISTCIELIRQGKSYGKPNIVSYLRIDSKFN